MNETLKNFLKLIQIIFIAMMPLAMLNHFFSDIKFFNFIAPYNVWCKSVLAGFVTFNTDDWSFLALFIPLFLGIIIIGIIIAVADRVHKKVEETVEQQKFEKIAQQVHSKEQRVVTMLEKKKMVYVTVDLIFAKFTISTLSDREIDEKKLEIKKELTKDLVSFHGTMIEDEDLSSDTAFAMLFTSQDEALGFVMKLKDLVAFFDNETQSFGYALGFKAIMDSQPPEALKYYVVQFMDKALRTVELGEICTTNDFARRYKEYGKMKNISFISKGNYSISKARVELNKVVY